MLVLPEPDGTDKGNHGAGRNGEGEVIQGTAVGVGVAQAYVRELDGGGEAEKRHAAGLLVFLVVCAEHVGDAFGEGPLVADETDGAVQAGDARHEPIEDEYERDESGIRTASVALDEDIAGNEEQRPRR